MRRITDLHKAILISCSDDYTGLWEIIRDVQRVFNNANAETIREKTIATLHDLLSAGLIQPGFPKPPDGRTFEPWVFYLNDEKTRKLDRVVTRSIDEAIDLINKGWDVLGREPSLGDIVWFTVTEQGNQQLRDLQSTSER